MTAERRRPPRNESDSAASLCADRERVALGTEDGLFVVEVTRDGETGGHTDTPTVDVTG